MKQAPAVRHGDGFGPAQDVELAENGLDVALDGDFGNGERCADEFVGFAFGEQLEHFEFAWRQFLSR